MTLEKQVNRVTVMGLPPQNEIVEPRLTSSLPRRRSVSVETPPSQSFGEPFRDVPTFSRLDSTNARRIARRRVRLSTADSLVLARNACGRPKRSDDPRNRTRSLRTQPLSRRKPIGRMIVYAHTRVYTCTTWARARTLRACRERITREKQIARLLIYKRKKRALLLKTLLLFKFG